jgi:hypothetical protein
VGVVALLVELLGGRRGQVLRQAPQRLPWLRQRTWAMQARSK